MARRLIEIWVYPVKSLGGIRLPSSKVLPKGLEHDRRWMLIDENNQFITQRVHHELALFKTNIINHHLTIYFQNTSISIPIGRAEGQPFTAQVWGDDVVVKEVAREYSEWFSAHLKKMVRLVVFPEENTRAVDEKYQIQNEQVSLADGYPVLVIGQASLEDLNNRLEAAVPMNRFRPNLVFSGGVPYEEDAWASFTVGSAAMRGVKPCGRCVVTTIEQETAVKEREPLLTLSKYRKREEKIYFGQNALVIESGEISEGDEITVE